MPTQPPAAPLVSFAALERAFSRERLQGYHDPSDRDETDTVARYLWNLALANAVQPALHTLEVTFRNEIYRASVKLTEGRSYRTAGIACWLDATPSFLLPNEAEKVVKARSRLGNDPRSQTPGHLVAKLDFGFWVALCQDPYADWRREGPRLWPRALDIAFTSRPDRAAHRSDIHRRFDAIRMYRNRIAHHEPVWDRDYLAQHEHIVESLGWINRKVAQALRATSPAVETYHAGPAALRPCAETLLEGGPGLDGLLDPKLRRLGPDRRALVAALVDALLDSPAPADPAEAACAWASTLREMETGQAISPAPA